MSENLPAVRVEEGEIVSEPHSYEDHLRAWRVLEIQAEDRRWMQAKVASSLCGNYDGDTVKQFAREVDIHPNQVYAVARGWQLRMSMEDERLELSEWKRNRPLTPSHFIIAAKFDDPQATIRRCVREGISTSRLQKIYDDQRDKRPMIGRASRPRQIDSGFRVVEGREDEPALKVVESGQVGQIVRKTHVSGCCDTCGSEITEMPALGRFLKHHEMTAGELAYESSVDEGLIEHLLDGGQIAQSLCYRIQEVAAEKQGERRRQRRRMGME